MTRDTPRVAVAHEWLVRYAGSERVVEELVEAFAVTRILTTLVEPEELPEALRGASPSLLQHIPRATRHHEWLVPLMPLAWRLREPVGGVDAVISSSHACANAVRVADGVPHVSYCHTPMRYVWGFAGDAERLPGSVRRLAGAALAGFRRWDRATAARVTRFVANSSAVAARIARSYGRPSDVVFPPVRTDFFTRDGGGSGDAFLYVGRLVPYKQPALVVEAFRDLPFRLRVVGDGPLRAALEQGAADNVEFLGNVDDERLRGLYRDAAALVYPAEEDFGLVMAEAQACGTPVIGYRRGGAADIVDDGETGWLVERHELPELRRAIRRAAVGDLDRGEIAARAQRFAAERFRSEMRRVVAETIEAARQPRPRVTARTDVPSGT